MFLQNISKRKVLLLIINALVSVLLISCVLFLYHYLPTTNNSRASIFTIEKGNGVHITKSHHNPISGTPTRSVIVANVKSPYTSRRPIDRFTSSEEEAIDDTIYIDNDSYGDENENYDINSNKRTLGSITTYQQQKQSEGDSDDSESDESYEQQKQKIKTPVTIIERPVERSPASDDDLYYENYEDETDDEDIVSSGDGKIIVNVKNTKKSTKKLQTSKKKLQKQRENIKKQPSQPEPANYIENVYSVSSEIVSNLKSQYNIDENGKQQTINQQQQQQQQQQQSDDNTNISSDDEDIEDDSPSTLQSDVSGMKNGKRLTGNNKKLAERSRQLILCRSGNNGELCRMLN
jgi:hypothetical protein